MDLTQARIKNILKSPVGCEFFLSAKESGISPEELGTPLVSFWLSAECVSLFDMHNSDHDEVAAGALERGKELGAFPNTILEHPATAWWFDPLDLAHQVWIGHEGKLPITSTWDKPGSPPDRWEVYAQKPTGLQYTSTLVGGLTSLFVAYDNGTCDLVIWPTPLPCWDLQIQSDVNVYEIQGPEDWHELCLRYPAAGTNAQGRNDGRLTPDWGAAATDWNAVHLSLGGLVTSLQVRNESPEGWSMLTFQDSETTYWLNNVTSLARRLPDHDRNVERDNCPDNLVLADPTPGRRFGVPLMRVEDPKELEELRRRFPNLPET